MPTRRHFIKTTALGSLGLLSGIQNGFSHGPVDVAPDLYPDLYTLSNSLLEQWAGALLELQVTDRANLADYGGIKCPAKNIVHGRVGDTIYPFAHLAHQSGDGKYMDAAMLLYRWMERTVSQPDGSWLNEPVKGAWKGTTIFSIIALGETLKNHASVLDGAFQIELKDRLKKAGEYVFDTFTIDYGNINYPISASYGLTLLDTLLDIPKFGAKGKELAHQSLQFISKKDHLLTGEGDPYYEPSKKGCFSVDLGYNVEESLPSLALYGLLTKDEEILQPVVQMLQSHMEFMLPDGAWDNSWGTRNYKWTYWGSRTSDGCQPAYALLADRDPRFGEVAARNTQLLAKCTVNGLLYGGLHNYSHQVPPSVHHTFCHSKALTTILDHQKPMVKSAPVSHLLPRSETYGGRFFSDIQTWLVAKGGFRATVTAYDRNYKAFKNGHASGGALTMLWHEKTGPLLCASMNEYQLWEALNQQEDTDPLSMSLTPRIELKTGGKTYTNISDLSAVIETETKAGAFIVNTHAQLVDKDQLHPPGGPVTCRVSYQFAEKMVTIDYSYEDNKNNDGIRIVFPVISEAKEKLTMPDSRNITIEKAKAMVKIRSNRSFIQLPVTGKRLFNQVPGLEAVPFAIAQNEAQIQLRVE